MRGVLGPVELVREAATLVMLLTVGMLAARTWPSATRLHGDCVRRLGHFLLRVSQDDLRLAEVAVRLGHSLPAAAAVVGAGARARLHRGADDRVGHAAPPSSPIGVPPPRARATWWRLSGLGIALALYVFMADSLRAVHQGLDVTRDVCRAFNWPVFCVALALMAAPVAQIAWRLRLRQP